MKIAIWCMLFLSLSLLAYSSAVDNHTVLLLNFDKDSVEFKGGEIVGVRDQSGNDNDATVNTQSGEPAVNLNVKPSGPPELVDGRFGKGLYFDGTNSLEVLTSESLEITDGITLEAWVNPEVLTIGADSMTAVTKDTSYYMVLRNSGFLACYFYGTNPPGYHLGKKALEAGEWTHIAITHNGKKATLYVNAEVEAEFDSEGQITPGSPPQSVGIGCEVRTVARAAPNQRYFKGIMDEVRISDVARTQAEIAESFESGLQLAVRPAGKLAATWGMIRAE